MTRWHLQMRSKTPQPAMTNEAVIHSGLWPQETDSKDKKEELETVEIWSIEEIYRHQLKGCLQRFLSYPLLLKPKWEIQPH